MDPIDGFDFGIFDSSVFDPNNMVESVSVAESLAASEAISQAVSESVSIAESLSSVVENFGSTSETVALSDGVESLEAANQDVAETVTNDESVSVSWAHTENISESLSLSDSIASEDDENVNLSETISLSDSTGSNYAGIDGVSETVANDESVAVTSQYIGAISESISVSEAIATEDDEHVNLTETVSLEEAISSTLISGSSTVYSESVSEIIGLVEVISGVVAAASGLTETVALVEAADCPYELLETISTSEALVATVQAAQAISEYFGPGGIVFESMSAGQTISINVDENLTLVETTGTQQSGASVGETLILTETLTAFDVFVLPESVSVTELIGASEQFIVDLSDTLGLVELLKASPELVYLDETIDIQESLTAIDTGLPFIDAMSRYNIWNGAALKIDAKSRYSVLYSLQIDAVIRYSTADLIIDCRARFKIFSTPIIATLYSHYMVYPASNPTKNYGSTRSPFETAIFTNQPQLNYDPTVVLQSATTNGSTAIIPVDYTPIQALVSVYVSGVLDPGAVITAGGGSVTLSTTPTANHIVEINYTPANSVSGGIGLGGISAVRDVQLNPNGSGSDYVSFIIVKPDGSQVDLSGIPYSFVIEFNESQATTWSLSIFDPFGEFCPLNMGSAFMELLDEQPFGPDGSQIDTPNIHKGVLYPTKVQPQLKKMLLVEATIGGKQWNFTGIGISWSYSRNWETRYFNFVWKGTDFSILLNKENQTMQTIRSNSRYGVHKASKVLVEMLGQYGVKYDLRSFTDDWTIPVMHRANGIPADWVTQILQALCYEWTMVGGDTFTPYLPVSVPTAAFAAAIFDYATGKTVTGQSNTYTYDLNNQVPSFIYDFAKMSVYDETCEGSLMALYNRVIAIRAAEGNNTMYSMDVFNFGDSYTINFDPPLSFVTPVPTAMNNGWFSNYLYYRGAELIATRQVTSGSLNYGISLTDSGVIVGATSCKFTWGVLPGGFIGIGAPGHIEFHGSTQVEPSIWGGTQYGIAVDQGPDNPAPELRVFAENLGLINKYGLRPIEVPASPLLPTKAMLQVFANRMLYRLGRQARKGSYKVPLNPFIWSGSLIREIDISLGVDLTHPLVQDRVVIGGRHSFSNIPSERFTEYHGSTYTNVT